VTVSCKLGCIEYKSWKMRAIRNECDLWAVSRRSKGNGLRTPSFFFRGMLPAGVGAPMYKFNIQ
jgi:hypothetical protein